jgi:probable rRNA maturation factor
VSVLQHPRPAPFRGSRLRELARKALARLSPPEADLRILVVDDAEMRTWNRRFLDRPRTTNVLSFPEDDPRDAAGRLSGDILISAPTCLRQTRGWEGSPEERVFFFIVHGLLHLAGYDHERGREEARRMRGAEMELYLSVIGAPRKGGRA